MTSTCYAALILPRYAALADPLALPSLSFSSSYEPFQRIGHRLPEPLVLRPHLVDSELLWQPQLKLDPPALERLFQLV